LLITKHSVGITYLNGLREKAADIDNSAYVNTFDALGVQRRFIQMITSFPSGDWAFDKPVINLSGAVQQDVNIKAVCFGDVNASFVPAAKAEPSVSMDYTGELQIEPGEIFTVGIQPASAGDVGAVSLFLTMPDCYEVVDVQGPVGIDNLPVYSVISGIMGVSWFDARQSRHEALLQIKLLLESLAPGTLAQALRP